MTGSNKEIIRKGSNNVYYVKMGKQASPDDNNIYDNIFNYPAIGFGLSMSDFSRVKLRDNCDPGKLHSAYLFFDRTLFCKSRFKISYEINMGLTFPTVFFNPQTNEWNEFASSPIMVCVGISSYAKYLISSHIEGGLGVAVMHHSNGRLGMPNRGYNMIGVDLSLKYLFSETSYQTGAQHHKTKSFIKHLCYNFSFTSGYQTSVEEWENYEKIRDKGGSVDNISFGKVPKWAFYSNLLYRYSPIYASGIGLDFFYSPRIDKNKEWDKLLYGDDITYKFDYSKYAVGISIAQEIYYKSVSLYANMGVYILRDVGKRQKESILYQRAGFRWYMPFAKNVYLGYGIKAHNFSVAENLELAFGVNLNM